MHLLKAGLLLLVSVLPACGDGGSGQGAFAESRVPVNDTGMALCGDFVDNEAHTNNDIVCSDAGAGTETNGIDIHGDAVPAGQDAVYGRDSMMLDGSAAFSFTKLDSRGNSLSASTSAWACVRDNVTGLVWEAKADNGSLMDKDWTYTWFNPNSIDNGGNSGLNDGGVGAASDNCHDQARCDTWKYVADVNETQLCGFSDWRLPDPEELRSIVHFGRILPAIDTDYFPYTPSGASYWSAATDVAQPVQAWVIDVSDGVQARQGKGAQAAVRLVRKGSPFITIHVLE